LKNLCKSCPTKNGCTTKCSEVEKSLPGLYKGDLPYEASLSPLPSSNGEVRYHLVPINESRTRFSTVKNQASLQVYRKQQADKLRNEHIAKMHEVVVSNMDGLTGNEKEVILSRKDNISWGNIRDRLGMQSRGAIQNLYVRGIWKIRKNIFISP